MTALPTSPAARNTCLFWSRLHCEPTTGEPSGGVSTARALLGVSRPAFSARVQPKTPMLVARKSNLPQPTEWTCSQKGSCRRFPQPAEVHIARMPSFIDSSLFCRKKSKAELAIRPKMPARVPAVTIIVPVATTALDRLTVGPNRRSASVNAASTARVKTGSMSMDSRSQSENGAWVLWMWPAAIRSDITQNQSAHVIAIAKVNTADHGTEDRPVVAVRSWLERTTRV